MGDILLIYSIVLAVGPNDLNLKNGGGKVRNMGKLSLNELNTLDRLKHMV